MERKNDTKGAASIHPVSRLVNSVRGGVIFPFRIRFIYATNKPYCRTLSLPPLTGCMIYWPSMNLLDIAKTLPKHPGVYLFHGADDVVLYVGKANSLRARVSSYFQNRQDLGHKTNMVEQIERIEHILVRSETEALLLESTLIKKHRPKYNILLKDDKNFQYIKISLREKFPSVTTVRRIVLDGSRYFGPYTSGLAVRRTLRLLKRLFPYKNCTNPPDVPCFDFQLKRCLGHDTGPGSQERYREVIQRLMHFLEGHTGNTLKRLQTDMHTAARRQDFEQAALYRDRLEALHHILEQQTVVSPRGGTFDVISLARDTEVAAANLFQIRQGKLVQRDQFILQHTQAQSDPELLSAFIEQYYSQSTNHPTEIYVPVDLLPSVGQPLQLKIKRAQRGLKRTLLKMGEENARDYLERERVQWLSEQARANLGLKEIAAALKLESEPQRIEMYDISNFQGRHAVGSMVVFTNGRPDKDQYRKFKIKTIHGSDDVHMLAEVLLRRFARSHADWRQAPESSSIKNKTETSGAWPAPNLVILDGGKPQLNTVTKNVKSIPKDVPVVALAKQEEELFTPKRASPIRLAPASAGLLLIQRIRDEAHRFAIGYYRKKHAAAMTASRLDDVLGLGPAQKKKLMHRFGSLAGIRKASDTEITEVIGPRLTAVLRDALG